MKRQKPFNRGAGILLAISSLPSPYGIGTLGDSAYKFVDFLKKSGQSYWQVLPIGPTSYGDSPYQSFSAFAGNPYFIDLISLAQDGLLKREDIEAFDWGKDEEKVDYQKLYDYRFNILRMAYENSNHKGEEEYKKFCADNDCWLADFSEFMAVKKHFGDKSWQDWPDDIRMKKTEPCEELLKNLEYEIDFIKFCQFYFFKQWKKLKDYANRSGIKIIGDIPIYVSPDSADVWAGKEEFELDKDGKMINVAGVPPDEFSDDGQKWGNPLYNWEEMEKNGFTWWKLRMEFSARMFDVIRIDHFIGIERYYSVSANSKNAKNGKWKKGPGIKLLNAVSEVLGNTKIIAEDLGAVTPAVTRLRLKAGYPGMKILEYAFGTDSKNKNLPHNFETDCVVYGGTHDNETLAGFFKRPSGKDADFAREYLNVKTNKKLAWATIRAGYASVASLAVFQMQDFLELDNSARMNFPSTVGDNWKWRLKSDEISDELAEKIYKMAKIYGRVEDEV
ncbi:MAG: 4-alpha-glucanotransferase [Clostridia bacterium]|nr:4-alpha-glucanotransferase [Clostridia bacterium]